MNPSYGLDSSNFGKFISLKSSNEYINSNFGLITKTIRWCNNYLLALLDSHLIHYPSPLNLTYAWSFGSSAGICLVIQILSGIFLAMHYTPHIDFAFSSVEHIMRDVNNGWLIRYIHANGASMFFIVVYCHIFRGLYYGSYMQPRQLLWCSGVLIFILMMATAFMGYVLPWGQMSFWGATVITSLVTAVPVIGQSIVDWLWGGFTVNNATLNRFFSLHFFLPFIIAALSLVHLALLHKDGSNNPLGVDSKGDKIPFYPYFVVKDLFAFFCFLTFFGTFAFYFSNTLGHLYNYIPADPMAAFISLTKGISISFHFKVMNFFFDFWEIFWSNNNSNNDLKNIQNQETGILCTSGDQNNRGSGYNSISRIVLATISDLMNQDLENLQDLQNALNARLNEVNPSLRHEVRRELERFYRDISARFQRRFPEDNIQNNPNDQVQNNQQNNEPAQNNQQDSSIVSDDESLD